MEKVLFSSKAMYNHLKDLVIDMEHYYTVSAINKKFKIQGLLEIDIESAHWNTLEVSICGQSIMNLRKFCKSLDDQPVCLGFDNNHSHFTATDILL